MCLCLCVFTKGDRHHRQVNRVSRQVVSVPMIVLELHEEVVLHDGDDDERKLLVRLKLEHDVK